MIALAGLLALATASCGSSSARSSGSRITIVEQDYYGAPTPSSTAPEYLNSFFAKYSKQHPGVTVKRQSPASPNYSSLVLSQIASGSAPDLLMVDNPDLASLASAGVLVPLDSLGKVDTTGINPSNIEETTYKGKLYALSLYTNTIAIFYNKDILREGGVRTLPKTWDEFREDAKKLSSPSHYGFVFSGQTGPGQSTWQFEPWLWSNGGKLTDISSPRSVQALSFYASLVRDGSAPRDVVNWSQVQPIQEFEAGKAAFCENGLWNIPPMKSQFKNLHWGVLTIPTSLPGQTVVAPIGGEVWTIPKTTPAREHAALEVLKAMATPQNIVPLATGLSDVPTRTSLWSLPEWSGEDYKPFFTELKTARSRTRNLTSNYPQVDTIVGNAVASALIGSKSAHAAFVSAHSDIGKVLNN